MKKVVLAILAMLSCLAFVACVPGNVDKAKEKMKQEGYAVLGVQDYEGEEGLVGGFTATKVEWGDADNLTALLFSTQKEARSFYNNMEDNSRAFQDGKWVYWGTEDAVEDFKD